MSKEINKELTQRVVNASQCLPPNYTELCLLIAPDKDSPKFREDIRNVKNLVKKDAEITQLLEMVSEEYKKFLNNLPKKAS
jgi:hypothetical protein